MGMSQAAIEGISVNGHRWKAQINLGQSPAILGKLNDLAGNGEPVDEAKVETLAENIVRIVRAYAERQTGAVKDDLLSCADQLEMVANCGLDEVNCAMNELYDSFDYWRILVQRPRT